MHAAHVPRVPLVCRSYATHVPLMCSSCDARSAITSTLMPLTCRSVPLGAACAQLMTHAPLACDIGKGWLGASFKAERLRIYTPQAIVLSNATQTGRKGSKREGASSMLRRPTTVFQT